MLREEALTRVACVSTTTLRETPVPRAQTGASSIGVLVPNIAVSLQPVPASTRPPSFRPTPKTLTASAIIISDSDSESEVEATYPRKIRKMIDCFDLTDDETGKPYLRQTYHAATDTYLD